MAKTLDELLNQETFLEKDVDEINACEKYTKGFKLELYSEPSWSVADLLSKV